MDQTKNVMPSATLRFSIIIPAYNRGQSISETINSVVNQSYPHWELIVVDDGSTDNTKEVIESFSKIDERINYLYQENSERAIARNNGADHAKFEYLIFLDSDDFFEIDHLKNLATFISENDNELALYFTNVKIFQNGKLNHVNLNTQAEYSPQYFWTHRRYR